MKPVHDADNTIPLDVYNFKDIAGCARRFADQLEAGVQGEPIRVVAIIETPEGVGLALWGENATRFEIMGLLEVAKQRHYEEHFIDD
jgi:hypothetical protein